MLIGQTLSKDCVVRSPWFPRNGDAATFVCEVLDASGGGGATLDIDIEHKNLDELDSDAEGGAPAASFTQITSAGVSDKRATALKELVRFKFTVGGSLATDWVHFRVLPPAWEIN